MKRAMFLLLILLSSCATNRGLNHSTMRTIEEVIENIDPNVSIGIQITSLKNNSVVYEKNAGRHFVPSSTLKLATLAGALYYLGPSFRFNTGLYTDEFKGNTIKNLYLKGSGDPSLMDFDLTNLASELKQMGIDEILGHVFIDDQIFDNKLWASGIMWDDRDRGFSAPVMGINLNYNRLLIKTVAAHAEGLKAHSVLAPRSSFVSLDSSALTKKSGKNISYKIERSEKNAPTNDGLHQGDKILIDGHTSKPVGPNYQLLAVNDPSIFAGTFLKDELLRFGIKVKGSVERQAVPASAVFLTEHQSRSLAEALIDFTKISNNVANDALIKAIAAKDGSKPASLDKGLKLINDFLSEQVGMSKNILLADGSGLSRYNLITPKDMVKLLTYASNDFHMGPEFVASLPIGGEDGTLGARFLGDMRGQVRAKTGSMTGISCLAGYMISENDRFAFAIMINGFVGAQAKYSRLQENILAALSGHSLQVAEK
jgi:D-alanyl-D-alanine carboxypeptidase/D-alanyl-D-alanine-endopeptidase (penicillin-binding protein 4)